MFCHFWAKYFSYSKMILYVENGSYDLCLWLSCNNKREVLPFSWVREVVMHQNSEKNPVLTKTWSHEVGLPTQQVCCHQPDHSKRPSPRVSLKKYVFPPIKWFLLFGASGQKIRSIKKRLFKWGKKMLWITAWLPFQGQNAFMWKNCLHLLFLKSFRIFSEWKQRNE